LRFHGKNVYANPPLINVARLSCILTIEQLLHSNNELLPVGDI